MDSSRSWVHGEKWCKPGNPQRFRGPTQYAPITHLTFSGGLVVKKHLERGYLTLGGGFGCEVSGKREIWEASNPLINAGVEKEAQGHGGGGRGGTTTCS